MTDTQAMSVRLPNDLYEKLRREAFDLRVPMNSLVIEGVEMRLARQARGNRNRAGRQTQDDERQPAGESE